MKKILTMLGIASMAYSAPSFAVETLNGACVNDLTLSAGSSLTSCYGRFAGNVLNTPGNADINTALTQLGYAGPAIVYSAIPLANILTSLSGSQTLNYAGVFNGPVYLGIHYGNGQGGPGNSTTFYRISASNLDTIGLTLNASSTATLFAGTVTTAVPETATWAMMIGGFGIVGAALRRRRQSAKVRTIRFG